MFSENHYKILKELVVGSSRTEELANKVGLPISFTKHLLEELKQNSFIEALYDRNSNGDNEIVYASLGNSGQAGIEAPEHFLGKPMNQQNGNNWYGDRVAGDKFTGDKVMGNKVQIGTVQGDVAGNNIVNSQNLNQAAQDIKALLDQLTIDYPNDDPYTQAGRAIGTIQNNPTLKQRTVNAVKEFGKATVQQAIEAVTDNRAVKVLVAGIEGFIEAEG